MAKASDFVINNFITNKSDQDRLLVKDPGSCIDALFTSAITSTTLGADVSVQTSSLNNVWNACVTGTCLDASCIAAATAAATAAAAVTTCTTLDSTVDYFDAAAGAITSKISANYQNFANLTFNGVTAPGTISGSVNKVIYYLSYDYLSLHSDATAACKISAGIINPNSVFLIKSFLLSPTTSLDAVAVANDIQAKILSVYGAIKSINSNETVGVVGNYLAGESLPLVATSADTIAATGNCFEAATPAIARVEKYVDGQTYLPDYVAGSTDPDPLRMRCMGPADIIFKL